VAVGRAAGPPPEDPQVPDSWPCLPDAPAGHGSVVDRRWAALTHLSIVPLLIAFPLVVVLSKGERSPYVCHQAVEALNFQTTVVLALLLCSMLVGALLLPVLAGGAVLLAVRAARASRRGAWHRYPLTLRLVS
jgi:uncharacterized protein